jgi:predicted ATPase
MRVHLLEIQIEGFRAIRAPLSLALQQPAGGPLQRIVVAGPNGSGKTSLLEAIILALGREDLLLRDLPSAERGDHWRTEIPIDAKLRLQCQLPFKLGTREQRFNKHEEFQIYRTANSWDIRWTLDDGQERSIRSPADVRKFLREIDVEYFSSWRAPILPGGLQATTRGRPPQDTEANRLRRFKQKIINERARRAFESDPSQAHDSVWLERLNKVWRAFHRDGSTIDAGIVDPTAEDTIFDLFVFDGSTRRCSIDQISSGELELLTFAGTLLFGEFNGILMIDEPELHLHREWQRQLIGALSAMAPEAQLIVTTHADAPWDQVYSFERFFLAAPNDPRATTNGG